MKEKIIIQNVLKFENDKGKGTRIEFYFARPDAIANSKSYKGFSANACFYRDTEVFDKIPVDVVGKTIDCTLKSIPSVKNPMTSITMIESIIFSGNNIRLLQSE